MKTILKSLVLAALFVGLGSTAYAQEVASVNTNITASANVMSALTLIKDTDINFGSLSATTPGDVFLSPTGAGNTNTGVTTTVGKFILDGAFNTSVKVSWPATLTLTNGLNGEIEYALLVHGFATDVPGSSESLGAIGVGITADVSLSEDGSYFLYVGGSLGTLAGQAIGMYTATANFTVEYN